MSTLTKRVLVLAVFVLYMILLFLFFLPNFTANCCGGIAADETTQTDRSVNTFPLASKWDTLGIFQGPGFDDLKARILSGQGDDNILEIIGYYYEGESTPEGNESMGLARASMVHQTHFSEIPADQLKLSARPFPASDEVKTGFFSAASISWIQQEETIKEDVEELDDRIVIRFPFNSAEKVYNVAVDSFLLKLADQMKSTGERVVLTGHTDNVGGVESNLDLGMRRATAIRDILVGYGVDPDLISTDSKGLSLPVDTNNTEEGRQNNRRVEVVRIPVEEPAEDSN